MGILLSQIEDDLRKSFDAGKAFEKAPSPEALYEQLFYATRSLLVVKGLEANSEAEVFDLFRDHFIGTGIASDRYSDLMTIGKQNLASRRISESREQLIRSFCDHIFQLYQDMDDDLRFPGEERDHGRPAMAPQTETTSADASVDYRGIPCPMNYVKAKLALEGMPEGATLEILIDDGEPIDNMPLSLSTDGQEIRSQKKEDGHWRVVVVKRV